MRNLERRLTALEQHRASVQTVFVLHGQATPDGRCPDCEQPLSAHFTIDIDRASPQSLDAA